VFEIVGNTSKQEGEYKAGIFPRGIGDGLSALKEARSLFGRKPFSGIFFVRVFEPEFLDASA
jgi:hypothetical protein